MRRIPSYLDRSRFVRVHLVGAISDEPGMPEQPDPYTETGKWQTWSGGWDDNLKLSMLDPTFREKVLRVTAALNREYPGRVYFNNGFRHPASQALFIASGQTDSRVKWSKHNGLAEQGGKVYGNAFALDVNLAGARSDAERAVFYKRLRDLALAEGLISGANFRPSDTAPPKEITRWAAYGLGWDPLHIEIPITAEQKATAKALATADAVVWSHPTGVNMEAPITWVESHAVVDTADTGAQDDTAEPVDDFDPDTFHFDPVPENDETTPSAPVTRRQGKQPKPPPDSPRAGFALALGAAIVIAAAVAASNAD